MSQDKFSKSNIHDILNLLLSIEHTDKKSVFEKIKAILDSGMDFNQPVDSNGNSLLHYLILSGKSDLAVDFIKFLKEISEATDTKTINHLINFELKNNEGKTVIFLATCKGFDKVVEQIVKSIKVELNGMNIPDNEGRTPLMIAAALGYRSCAFWVINCNANTYVTDKLGNNIEYYLYAPEKEISELLLVSSEIAQQENTSSSSSTSSTASTTLTIAQCLENQKATRKLIQEHLLRHACIRGDIVKVKEYIEAGVDPFQADLIFYKKNVLQYTFFCNTSAINSFISIFNLNITAEDCIKNQAEICQYLLKKHPKLALTIESNDFLILKQDAKNGSDAEKERAKTILSELEYKIEAIIPFQKQPEQPELETDYTILEHPIIGTIISWNLESIIQILDNPLNNNLLWCIEHIHEYEKYKKEYSEFIQNDNGVKWFLIPYLIFDEQIRKTRGKKSLHYPRLGIQISELLKNQTLFSSLVSHGAKYKHILFGGTNDLELTTKHLETLLHLFTKEVLSTPEGTHSFISQLTLYFHENSENKLILEKALLSGADINERIDTTHRNTALHYLIALETKDSHQNAITFIDISEKMRARKANKNCIIDYTLQDNHGKTALLFAVALGAEEIVDKLLSVYFENKGKNIVIDIGLNIADNKGRTPLMAALALGHKSIVEKLLKANCNIWDKDKIDHYLQASEKEAKKEIEEILSSVSVYPNRAYGCHNLLYSDAQTNPPLIFSDKHGNKNYVFLSPKGEDYQLLLKALLYMIFPPEEEGKLSAPMSFKQFFIQIATFLDTRKNSPKLLPLIKEYNKYNTLWKVFREISENPDPHSIIQKYPRPDILQKIIDIASPLFSRKPLDIPTQLEKCLENRSETRVIFKGHLLRLACVLGDFDTVKSLLSENKDLVNSYDSDGRTPLHYTVMREQFVITYLTEKSPDLQGQALNKEKEKSMNNHVQIFEFLLSKGAYLDKTHNKGKSARHILEDTRKGGYTGGTTELEKQVAGAMLKIADKKNRSEPMPVTENKEESYQSLSM